MSITVLKPGLLSSFQDLGRYGHQHLGVPAGGAMDGRAHQLANLLVGNPENEAALEVTLVGPSLRFDTCGCIAICGAHLSPSLNKQPIPNNRPLIVRAGDVLTFGARTAGLRAYIAWHGGIALPMVLNSRSTYLRGGFGGFHGQALKKDDVFNMLATLDNSVLDDLERELWNIKVYLPAILGLASLTGESRTDTSGADAPREVRVMRGAHTPLFTDASIAEFFTGEYRVSPQSERMGYRLQGPLLSLKSSTQLLSESTGFGSIQVPPDGQPIILMADRQTTGGYAKIGHAATVDLPVIAQSMPGNTLRFTEITLDQAQHLDAQRVAAFGQLQRELAPLRALFQR